MLDVLNVECHAALKRRVLPRSDLPKTGHTGHAVQALEIVIVVGFDVIRRMRPGSYEAHLPTDDVPELGKFVEAIASQESAEAGNTWVLLDFKECTLPLIARA